MAGFFTTAVDTDALSTPINAHKVKFSVIPIEDDSFPVIAKVFLSTFPERSPNDRIFESLNPSNLFRAIHSTAKLAGLKEIKVHDLRHSCCSLLFHLGVSELKVKNYLGHSNIQTTLNIYAHLYPEALDEVTEKLQAVEDFSSIEFNKN